MISSVICSQKRVLCYGYVEGGPVIVSGWRLVVGFRESSGHSARMHGEQPARVRIAVMVINKIVVFSIFRLSFCFDYILYAWWKSFPEKSRDDV